MCAGRALRSRRVRPSAGCSPPSPSRPRSREAMQDTRAISRRLRRAEKGVTASSGSSQGAPHGRSAGSLRRHLPGFTLLHRGNLGAATGQGRSEVADRAEDVAERSIARQDETKWGPLTTEFWVMVVLEAAILIAAAIS